MKTVRTAVFPVAGLGTRFLPATKAIPKEMLPVVDSPLIQYAVDEALEAGIEHCIFITGRGKHAIEDHFDRAFELETVLQNKKKDAILKTLVANRPQPGQMSFIRQQEPLGLGHAVWCARHLAGTEPFAVILPDELICAQPGCLTQMMGFYRKYGGNITAVMEVPETQVDQYGILKPGKQDGQIIEALGLVEKPAIKEAPSRYAMIGRYILQPEIFEPLSTKAKGAGGEIQLTDAMTQLIGRQALHGYRFQGKRFDCGSKVGFLEANIALALERPDLAPALRNTLKKYS